MTAGVYIQIISESLRRLSGVTASALGPFFDNPLHDNEALLRKVQILFCSFAAADLSISIGSSRGPSVVAFDGATAEDGHFSAASI